jgi:hypothetical protein
MAGPMEAEEGAEMAGPMEREPNVFLRGGPAEAMGVQDRVLFADDVLRRSKVVVPSGNRYEHYAATGETTVWSGHELMVFQWSGGTFVAE